MFPIVLKLRINVRILLVNETILFGEDVFLGLTALEQDIRDGFLLSQRQHGHSLKKNLFCLLGLGLSLRHTEHPRPVNNSELILSTRRRALTPACGAGMTRGRQLKQ